MTSFGTKQVVKEGFMPSYIVQGKFYNLYGSLIQNTQKYTTFLLCFVGENEKKFNLDILFI